MAESRTGPRWADSLVGRFIKWEATVYQEYAPYKEQRPIKLSMAGEIVRVNQVEGIVVRWNKTKQETQFSVPLGKLVLRDNNLKPGKAYELNTITVRVAGLPD